MAGRADQLDVAWDPRVGANRGYVVQWKTGDEDWASTREAIVTDTNHRITDLAPATTYTVRVAGRVYDETINFVRIIDIPGGGDLHGLVWVNYDDDGVGRVVRDQGGFHNGATPGG